MTDIKTTLAGLHDIRGVQGSFLLLAESGDLVARDAMPVVSDENLSESGRRLTKVYDAVAAAAAGAAPEELMLRFEGLVLFTRRSARLLLAVLVNEAASVPALRMASTLVLRELEAVPLSVSPRAPAPASTPDAPRTRQFWRGTPIG